MAADVAAAVIVAKVLVRGWRGRVVGRRAGVRTRPCAAPGRPPAHRVDGDRAVTAPRCGRPAARPGGPWRAVAQPRSRTRQVCGPGPRRRRATAGPRTARPGRIGWQVLLMLARAADCARVTKQYELLGKAEISPGGSSPCWPDSRASARWPSCWWPSGTPSGGPSSGTASPSPGQRTRAATDWSIRP